MKYQNAQVRLFNLLRDFEFDINQFLSWHKDGIIDIQMERDRLLIIYRDNKED